MAGSQGALGQEQTGSAGSAKDSDVHLVSLSLRSARRVEMACVPLSSGCEKEVFKSGGDEAACFDGDGPEEHG